MIPSLQSVCLPESSCQLIGMACWKIPHLRALQIPPTWQREIPHLQMVSDQNPERHQDFLTLATFDDTRGNSIHNHTNQHENSLITMTNHYDIYILKITIWSFPKMRVFPNHPFKIIFVDRIFHERNHPAITPMTMETSIDPEIFFRHPGGVCRISRRASSSSTHCLTAKPLQQGWKGLENCVRHVHHVCN